MPVNNTFEHVQQINWGYCLPACTQMAYAQLGIKTNQESLAIVLGTKPGIGTPFFNITRLTEVKVEVSQWVSVEQITKVTTKNVAIITAISTSSGLPRWGNIRTQHTVLVTNITPELITYHDPAFERGPYSVNKEEFLLAWANMSELTAFLSKKQE